MHLPGASLPVGPVSPSIGSSGGSDPHKGAPSGGGGGPLARHVKRKLAGLLDGWRRVKSFRLFLEPVDVEQMECPTYYDVIKNPMDLRTMEAKLERDEYRSEEAFVCDLLLIFRNCRTFNDEATPAGQFVLRLCAEAEARSLEDLKKACKDSKAWAALEQQFSHGKQKAGARQKGGGASKRAASGGASASENTVSAAAAGPAAAAPSAVGRSAAADHNTPPQSYDSAGRNALGASPGLPCVNGLVYSGSSGVREEVATALPAREAAVSERVEGVVATSENASESTLQQTSTSGLAGVSPPSIPLTPGASGSQRAPSQANWQGEGGSFLGQGMLDIENCLAGKSWYIYCRDNILRPLKGDRYAYLFLTPVLDSPELPDAVKTSYKSVIARPMDYGTIWTKLTARDYHHPLEFFEDMFLVYSNCMAFNPPNDQQCGWLHRVAEKSRDKFVERWRRWVVRIWRAFAQHNAAAAAAPPPVLENAEAANAAAAVESEPAVAAGLAAARAELLERRHSHPVLPFAAPPQQLQQQTDICHAPLQHPQLQHPPAQHNQRCPDKAQDPSAVAASAAAAAKDPKYRALVVDLLGEDALEDASNSSLDRAATTQETLQQQLQQLQQQQQLLQHEHLQLQQQQLEMQEKEQALARVSAAGEGPVHCESPANLGVPGSSDLQQHQQQQEQLLQAIDPVAEHTDAAASTGLVAGATAGNDTAVEQQQHGDAAAAAGDVTGAAEGRKHKNKKQKHQKHMQRTQQQLQKQEAQNVQLPQEASAGVQLPSSGLLETQDQADSGAVPGYHAAAGVEEATPSPAAPAAFAAAPPGCPQVDYPAGLRGAVVVPAAVTDAPPFPVSVSPQQAAAVAATLAADAAGSSLLPNTSLGDSPRLCDIIEAPPAEILKAMGVKEVPARPIATPVPAAASAVPVAAPVSATDATLISLPPAAGTTAEASATWLAGPTPSQLSAGPAAAAAVAAPPAAATATGGVRGRACVEGSSLPPPGDEVIAGTLQTQHSTAFYDIQQQHQLLHLQTQQSREDLLPPKLRILLESTRKKGPPPRLLLLPWRGRGNGPIPEGYASRLPSTSCGPKAAVGVCAAAGTTEATAAEPTGSASASDRSVKRETTQGDSVAASAEIERATEEAPPPEAAVSDVAEKTSSSREQRSKLSLRLRSSCTSRRSTPLSNKAVPRNVFFVGDEDPETEGTLGAMCVDNEGEIAATTAEAKPPLPATPVTARDATQTKMTLAAEAAQAAAVQSTSTAHLLRLPSRVSLLPEDVDILKVHAGLQQCGFVSHALSRCCSTRRTCSSIRGSNINNNCSSRSSSGCADCEVWLHRQTARIQPVGPLTTILGDTADCSCPVSVSVLRCVRLGTTAANAAGAAPLLLHLKLQGADAAAAALALKGEYLVSSYLQLAAAATAEGGDENALTLGGLSHRPAAATAPGAASASGSAGVAVAKRSCWCYARPQKGQENRGSLLAGRSVFSVERQAIRNLPRRLLEEAQQKKQRRGGIADGCLLGELWGSATQKPFGEAFGGGLLQVVLRAAASGGSGDALGSSCGSGCNRLACTNEECLSDGLRFIEDLNMWAAALPSELLLPVQQQKQQRHRILRLPALDVVLLHSEPLGLVTLSKPHACSSSAPPSAGESAAAVYRAADGLRSSKVELPLQLKTEVPSQTANRKKRASGDFDCGETDTSSSGCCCCCCFLANAVVQPAVEPLQAALCLG